MTRATTMLILNAGLNPIQSYSIGIIRKVSIGIRTLTTIRYDMMTITIIALTEEVLSLSSVQKDK